MKHKGHFQTLIRISEANYTTYIPLLAFVSIHGIYGMVFNNSSTVTRTDESVPPARNMYIDHFD